MVSTYDGVLIFATKMALYKPRRAVIATVVANFMQADFAEGSTAIAIFGLSPLLGEPLAERQSRTIIRSFKRQKLSSTIMSNLNMFKLHNS